MQMSNWIYFYSNHSSLHQMPSQFQSEVRLSPWERQSYRSKFPSVDQLPQYRRSVHWNSLNHVSSWHPIPFDHVYSISVHSHVFACIVFHFLFFQFHFVCSQFDQYDFACYQYFHPICGVSSIACGLVSFDHDHLGGWTVNHVHAKDDTVMVMSIVHDERRWHIPNDPCLGKACCYAWHHGVEHNSDHGNGEDRSIRQCNVRFSGSCSTTCFALPPCGGQQRLVAWIRGIRTPYGRVTCTLGMGDVAFHYSWSNCDVTTQCFDARVHFGWWPTMDTSYPDLHVKLPDHPKIPACERASDCHSLS